MVTEELQTTLRSKYNPDGSVLRKAQLRMLEMLDFIRSVCEKYDIEYWLDSGTLLGAARHGGFIPWDDDTDIGMTYENMIKFKNIMLNNKLSEDFVIQCHESDEGFYAGWIVVRDLKSEYLVDVDIHNMRKYRGLQVDIFPYENVNDKAWQASYLLNSMFLVSPLKGRYHLGFLKRYRNIFHSLLFKHTFPFFRKIFNGNKGVIRFAYGNFFKTRHSIENVFPLGSIEFEGITFRSPGNTSGYLTETYGDWHKIPDESKLETHNAQIVFK